MFGKLCAHLLLVALSVSAFTVQLGVGEDFVYYYAGVVHEGLYSLRFEDAYEDEGGKKWHQVDLYKQEGGTWKLKDGFTMEEGGLVFEFLYTPTIWWDEFGSIVVDSDDGLKWIINYKHDLFIPLLIR